MELCDSPEPIFAPTYWRRIRAINGRGDLLLGPDERGEASGAMVIAPPGVLLRAPQGDWPLTSVGWRQARWGPDRHGRVLIDQARPFALVEVALGQVVEDLAEWAPELLEWVAQVIERDIRVLLGRMGRDCRGRHDPDFASAYDDLMETRRAADDAFARLRGCNVAVARWLLDRPFSHLVDAYVAAINADRDRVEGRSLPEEPETPPSRGHLKLVRDSAWAATRLDRP